MELTVKESGVKTISEILLCDTAYNPAGRINKEQGCIKEFVSCNRSCNYMTSFK